MIKNDFLSEYTRNDYQRDNFNKFLKHIRFTFNIKNIHVAGTNGKGSTSTYLAEIYKANGYKVGLFTSPFLSHINEMIKINGEEINDDAFIAIFKEYEKYFKKFNLSNFEIETFIALTFFIKENCNICIIECGMGGELDATNVIDSDLAIVTSVSLEHTMFLGRSISEITSQKCGIFRNNKPVLIGDLCEDSINVVVSFTKEMQCPLYQIDSFHYENLTENGWEFVVEDKKYQINSFAKYSIDDACLAIKAINIMKELFPVDYAKNLIGLKNVKMDCRFDIVMDNPMVILDGAHNPEGINSLCETLNTLNYKKPIHTIFACFTDKNFESMINQIALVSNDVKLTTFNHPRARSEIEYSLYKEDYDFVSNYIELINKSIAEFPDDIILITGSLAFAGTVKEDIKNGIISK